MYDSLSIKVSYTAVILNYTITVHYNIPVTHTYITVFTVHSVDIMTKLLLLVITNI